MTRGSFEDNAGETPSTRTNSPRRVRKLRVAVLRDATDERLIGFGWRDVVFRGGRRGLLLRFVFEDSND